MATLNKHEYESAFTLVELSIVLVIIGLLIGGIIAAQSMIQTAKINKIVQFVSQYGIATGNFQTLYGSLPGDSSKISGPVTAYNGNENGILDFYGGADESVTFYQDLYVTGMIKEAYKPLYHYHVAAGYTHPIAPGFGYDTAVRASIADVENDQFPTLHVYYVNGTSPYSSATFGDYYNSFIIRPSGANINLVRGAIHSKIAAAIDNKMDDGLSNAGGIVGIHGNHIANLDTYQPCVNNTTNGYAMDAVIDGCSLAIKICKAQGIC